MNSLTCQLDAIEAMVIRDGRMGDVPTSDLEWIADKLRAMADAIDRARFDISPPSIRRRPNGGAV